MKLAALLSALMLSGCVTVQGPVLEREAFIWEAEAAKPHPVSTAVREVVGPLAVILTPTLMWAVADEFGDKAGHCFAGVGSSLAFGMLMQPKWGWVASISVGFAKEQIDSSRPGNRFDELDLAWTAGCGAVPFLLMERMR